MSEAADEITHDTLLRGRVSFYQPARGFRSSLDPVLLAAFVAPPFGRFADLGCGTGALSFCLLARDPGARGVGLELQPRLAGLAERSAASNGFGARFEVRLCDVRGLPRQASERGRFDLVATNPPYRPVGKGVLPTDRERSIANHEVELTMAGWLDAALALLAPSGRLAVVFPAARLSELEAGIAARGLRVVRRRLILPHAGAPPGRVLLEARREGELVVEPPLVVHEGGRFTAEAARLLGE